MGRSSSKLKYFQKRMQKGKEESRKKFCEVLFKDPGVLEYPMYPGGSFGNGYDSTLDKVIKNLNQRNKYKLPGTDEIFSTLLQISWKKFRRDLKNTSDLSRLLKVLSKDPGVFEFLMNPGTSFMESSKETLEILMTARLPGDLEFLMMLLL